MSLKVNDIMRQLSETAPNALPLATELARAIERRASRRPIPGREDAAQAPPEARRAVDWTEGRGRG